MYTLPLRARSSPLEDGATRFVSATSSPRIPQRYPRRPATSPAVCRVSPTSSKPASRRTPAILAEKERHGELRQGNQGQAPSLVITGEDSEKYEELIPKWRTAQRASKANPVSAAKSSPTASRTRTTSCACRASRRWRNYLVRRDPGRRPPAGREDQRQAHRGDHPPDAAQDRGPRNRRDGLPRGEQLDRSARTTYE